MTGVVNSPVAEFYTRGEQIYSEFYFEDECSQGVSGLDYVLHYLTGTSDYEIYAGVNDHGDGNYTYTWNSGAKALGWYNVTFVATKTNLVPENARSYASVCFRLSLNYCSF